MYGRQGKKKRRKKRVCEEKEKRAMKAWAWETTVLLSNNVSFSTVQLNTLSCRDTVKSNFILSIPKLFCWSIWDNQYTDLNLVSGDLISKWFVLLSYEGRDQFGLYDYTMCANMPMTDSELIWRSDKKSSGRAFLRATWAANTDYTGRLQKN